jgi:subtilisin
VDAGSGIKLLVLDTGVNKDHLDLEVSFCRNATGRRIKDNCHDQIGHGTHVAGSAAANGGADKRGLFGTAPGVTLGVEKICAVQCWLDDLIRAIEDATKNFHPQVMTLSFGTSDVAALRNAIDAAVADGTLFFAAAGNSGPGANTISYPAAYENVVAIGSLDAARIVNRMSSRGIDDGDDSKASLRELELSGGGLVIESTSAGGCYEVMSGTSMIWKPGIGLRLILLRT